MIFYRGKLKYQTLYPIKEDIMAKIDNDLLAFLLLEQLHDKGIISDSDIKKIREQKEAYITKKINNTKEG